MKKFSINKSQFATLVTLGVIVFLAASYLFIYIPSNEKIVQEQRFRSLQNIDRNIHAKIENSIGMLDLLIEGYHREPGDKDTVKKYINDYTTQNFKLELPVPVDKNQLVKKDSIDFYHIEVNNTTGILSIEDQHKIPKTANAVYKMQMQYKVEQFLKTLLPEGVFDEYIIFSQNKPVYETFPAGVSTMADSLLQVNKGVQGSVVRNFNMSGTDYKLFLQPVSFGSNEWVIGGLLSEKRYSSEKNQLPTGIVIFLVTIVLIIILFFPWIKLYQMGSKDRLTLTDAASTIVISMLLMSLLFFMFFKYNVPFRSNTTEDEKRKLAQNIIGAFEKERDSAYLKIDNLDQFADTVHSDIINFGKQNMLLKNKKSVPGSAAIKHTAEGFNIKQVYWLNSEGIEEYNWNIESINGPHGDFKNRPYFEMIKMQRHYLFQNSLQKKYYLDQLISRTTAAYRTVISIPSKARLQDSGNYVAVMSFVVKSLDKVVMPAGYQFAIIDNNAKVLYHSDSAKNLNENLLVEFSANDKLKSIIEARSEGYFTTGYFSNNNKVYVRPLNTLPYFIVILEDAGFAETRDMEVYSFTISSMLFFFAFVILQLLVTFVISSRRSRLKKQVFATNWIGPRVSAHRLYNLTLIENIFIIVQLLLFMQFSSFLLFVSLLLFAVTFLSLFLNILFVKKYKTTKPGTYSYKLGAVIWLAICIVLINIFGITKLANTNFYIFLLFELIAFCIGALLYFFGEGVMRTLHATGKPAWRKRWNYLYSFTCVVYARLIVASGIPIMFFYVTAYNYEQNLDVRYKQLQFANGVINKLSANQLDTISKGLDYRSGVYTDSSVISSLQCVPAQASNDKSDDSKEDQVSASIIRLFRLHLNDKAVNDEKFYADTAADLSFYHNELLREACATNRGTVTTVRTGQPNKYLRISSRDLNYKFPEFSLNGSLKGLLYWILMIGGLGFFYLILLNIIRKLFVLNMPDLTRWGILDEKILASKSLSNLVFVIGLPGSGKLTRIVEKIKSKTLLNRDGGSYNYEEKDDVHNDVFIVDLMNIPDAADDAASHDAWKFYSKKVFSSKNKLVIINHFEYNIQDDFTTRIKLNLLENLMVQDHSRIVILSTIHPVAFLDSALDHNFKTNGLPGQDLERWHVLLGHFRIVVFPLQIRKIEEKVAAGSLEEVVYFETKRTHFLNKMREITSEVVTEMVEKKSVNSEADELALKLQTTSHYFYMYIWQSLTKEEKFLLYDHAEDNLVNAYDGYNLNMLICKGVLVRKDGALKIFNNGFRNFILTAIGNIEAMKIKSQIKDNGNWSKLKNPMVIIILAILAFLIASQQEAYSKLIAYAAALGTAVPTIMRIFSFFDGTKDKSSG